METGMAVLALLMAFTGFVMLVGGFSAMMYILWQRGKESEGRRAAAAGGGSPRGIMNQQ